MLYSYPFALQEARRGSMTFVRLII